MNDDLSLLERYVRHQDEAAFATLVSRHVNLVYSVALRQVQDPHLAMDVTQEAFVLLARKAGVLGPIVVLPGWLCRTVRHVSANTLTAQRRRLRREQEAQRRVNLNDSQPDLWPQIAPHLDAAMEQLARKDHDALVLRYLEGHDFKNVGAALGTSEDAAKMRVNRALEKLRRCFHRRGIISTADLIATAIGAHSVQAAPAALAQSITAVATAKGLAAGSSTFTLLLGALKTMASTKLKASLVVAAALLLVTGTTTLLVERHIAANPYTVVHAPWSDVGAATPKQALDTLLWALTHHHINRALQLMQWEEQGTKYNKLGQLQHQFILASNLAPNLKSLESFRILSITPGPQPTDLRVKFQKTFKNRRIVPFAVTAKLHRAASQWHVVAQVHYYKNGNIWMLLPFTGSVL